jgi:hypothetical protein
MNAYSKFSELKPKLYQLEKEREGLLQTLQNQIFIGITLLLSGATAIYYVLIPAATSAGWVNHELMAFLLWGGLVYTVFSFLHDKSIGQYQKKIKDQVLNQLISSTDPNLSYDPTACIAENDFEASSLFDEGVSKYDGEDLITGQRNGYSFRLSELEVDKGTNKHPHVFFHGIFMIIDLAEAVRGQTFILPADYQESLVSRISKKLWNGGRSGEPVAIIDEEFNDIFKIISDDPLRAQQLLTPSFREVLIELEDQFVGELRLCIKGNQLYLAIATWEGLFAISHKDNLLNPEVIEDFEEDLNMLLQLVDVLSAKAEKEIS